jgi:class 3 adenylate cyclase
VAADADGHGVAAEAIADHNGIVDKFVGDGALALSFRASRGVSTRRASVGHWSSEDATTRSTSWVASARVGASV